MSRKDFDRLYGKLVAMFRRHGASPDEAGDLACEVLYRACKAIGAFEGRSSPDTWILSFVRPLWLNYRRSQRTLKRGAQEIPLEQHMLKFEIADVSPNLEKEILDQDLLSQVMAAIDRLPPEMGTALVETSKGASYAEVAEKMRIPAGRVADLAHQARTKLRRQFRPGDSDDAQNH